MKDKLKLIQGLSLKKIQYKIVSELEFIIKGFKSILLAQWCAHLCAKLNHKYYNSESNGVTCVE